MPGIKIYGYDILEQETPESAETSANGNGYTINQVLAIEAALSGDKVQYIAGITDYFTLQKNRDLSFEGSYLSKAIEDRMLEVITPELPNLDYPTLQKYRRSSSEGSDLRKAIEDQIFEQFENGTIILGYELESLLNSISNNYIIIDAKITLAIRKYFHRVIDAYKKNPAK